MLTTIFRRCSNLFGGHLSPFPLRKEGFMSPIPVLACGSILLQNNLLR